jgi:hypothetical protein
MKLSGISQPSYPIPSSVVHNAGCDLPRESFVGDQIPTVCSTLRLAVAFSPAL